MRSSLRLSIGLVLGGAVALGAMPTGSLGISAFASQTSVTEVEQTPASIARQLVERRAFVEIPLKGKVKSKVRMSDQTYAMPGGPSRVVLLKLPEYRRPYELRLASAIIKHWGLKEGVFVPTTMILDADFMVTRTVQENQLKPMRANFAKDRRLEATIPFGELHSGEQFLLVYTQAAAVGQRIDRQAGHRPILSSAAADAGNAIGNMLVRAERSADGTIEVETKPNK